MKTFSFILVCLVLLSMVNGAGAQDQVPDVAFVVARGDIAVDALVAQAYTQKASVPLITVTGEGLSAGLRKELQAYDAPGKRVILIGGEDAVTPGVESDLKSLGFTVERLWDWNRYGTAARVAVSLWGSSQTAVIVEGETSGALLEGVHTALETGSPLLLSSHDKLNGETLQALETLGTTRIILVGSFSEQVNEELNTLGGVEVRRTISRSIVNEPSPTSIFFIGTVVGALLLFVGSTLIGTAYWKKRREIPYSVLQEDEQKIVDVLSEAGGKIKQQDLPSKTGFSRPKVSRLVAELISRGVLEREQQGKTFTIRLHQEIRK